MYKFPQAAYCIIDLSITRLCQIALRGNIFFAIFEPITLGMLGVKIIGNNNKTGLVVL